MPTFRLWRSQQLQQLKEDSDRMFDKLCTEFGLPSVCQPLLEPELVMTDRGDVVVVEADVPGVEPEALDIRIEEGYLIVSCSDSESCESGATQSLYESRFRLPCRVRTEEVEAVLDEGVLKISMPKCKRPESRKIPVINRS